VNAFLRNTSLLNAFVRNNSALKTIVRGTSVLIAFVRNAPVRPASLAILLLFAEAGAQGLGNVTGVQIAENSLLISAGTDIVVFKACTANILEVNYRPGGVEDPDTLVVAKTSWDPAAALIDTATGLLSITTAAFRVEITRSPLRFRLYKYGQDGNFLICEEPAWGGISQNAVSFLTSAGTFYGIHNRSQGSLYTETGGAVTAGNQGQAGGPFAWTVQGWGFLADAAGGTITIAPDAFTFSRPFNPAKRDLEFYFIVGSPKEILRGLHDITGFPPLFPKYTYGFMNTEWGIDQAELYDDIRTYRGKGIPIDAFVLDFDWMDWGGDNYGEFRWGAKFPDGQSGAIVDTLKKYSINLMGIRKPRIHVYTAQGSYCQTHSLFVDYQTDYFSGQTVGRLNFHDPFARQWYWESFATRSQSYSKGITGYWNDEADEYGGNLMFMQMQRAQYEGQRALTRDRVWSINRNFYTGAQRYAYGLWSGDIPTGFSAMAEQKLFMLSSVTLGVSWWGMDVGGFRSTPSPENYYRWIQFGAFVPIFRVHGSNGQEREPWFFGAQAESIATRYIRLRYALLPYIYSAAWENHQSGLPLARPLIIDYPDDPEVSNLTSQWLFGNSILVSPVTTAGASQQSIYLPEGEWYDFNTGKPYPGQGRRTVSVSEDLPLFVKAGSIVPMSPPSLYTDSPEMKKLVILSSYPNGSGNCVVYDDDGTTYDYENGSFSSVSTTHVRTEEKATITIGAKAGVFVTPERGWMVQLNWVGASPDSVLLDGTPMRELSADTLIPRHAAGWWYDAGSRNCLVKFPDDKSGHLLIVYFPRVSSGQALPGSDLPHQYGLEQNYPNPFNPSTTFSMALPKSGETSLKVFNTLGEEVALVYQGMLAAGNHRFQWSAAGLPTGVYFYRLQSGDFTTTKKMSVMK